MKMVAGGAHMVVGTAKDIGHGVKKGVTGATATSHDIGMGVLGGMKKGMDATSHGLAGVGGVVFSCELLVLLFVC